LALSSSPLLEFPVKCGLPVDLFDNFARLVFRGLLDW